MNRKHRFRKSTILILTLIMVLNLLSVAAAAQFVDVSDGDWFAQPVSWALRNNITKGTTETTFSPYETCTRAQILTFLWRASDEPEPEIFCPFYDVYEAEYAYDAAIWAYENGLVEGNLFSGTTPCTRADVVSYLWKLAGSPYAETAFFYDVPAAAAYSQAVSWAVGEGVTNGMGNGMFKPFDICTRGQIVTFLYRAFVETDAMGGGVKTEEVKVSDGSVSQDDAAAILYGVESTYPEGTFWSIDSSYSSEALNMIYSGCAGFALYCSDLVFGDLPVSEVHSDFDRIKVGDMVRDEAGRHTVIVLEKNPDSIVVVEGNYNDTVHWNREIWRTDPEFYNFTVTTRYP